MEYRMMTVADIERVIPLYIDYYNGHEDGCWTRETVYKRIHQVLTREDSHCILLEDGDAVLGFAMGYMEQYDDGMAYDLIEIVIERSKQNGGLGTAFMEELERQVKAKGAFLIQLDAVNDAAHERFYDRLGYKTCTNLVNKSKVL